MEAEIGSQQQHQHQHLKMLTQHGLVVILACIFLAIVGVCATASMCGRRTRRMNEEAAREEGRLAHHREETDKKALMDSTRWSGANKLGDEAGGRVWSWITESTISGGGGGGSEDKLGTRAPPSMMRSVGAPTAPPVWQRRILMGERCEMPRFSGLILYDEHGRPLGHAKGGGGLREEEDFSR